MKKEEEEIREEIEKIKEKIETFEINPNNHEDAYEDMIRETTNRIFIEGIEFDPVEILSKIDPTAYRNNLLDYIDGIAVEDDEEYQELEGKLEDLELKLEEIEEEIIETYRGWRITESGDGLFATQENNQDVLGVKANWTQANDPILVLNAEEEWYYNGKQVADFGHNGLAAIKNEINEYEDN